jgi:hypothetical protein
LSAWLGGHRGQGLAEFALVFPLFILLLMGMVDLGRAVYAYNSITNAAREAARLAIVNQDTSSIEQRAEDMTSAIDVSTTVTIEQPDGSECDPLAIGCIVTVEVETGYQPITPVFGSVIGPMTLAAESQIGVEFVCPNIQVGFIDARSCPKQP